MATVEVFVIAQHPSGLQEEVVSILEGSPVNLARRLNNLVHGLQEDVWSGKIARFSILTEFNNSGRL